MPKTYNVELDQAGITFLHDAADLMTKTHGLKVARIAVIVAAKLQQAAQNPVDEPAEEPKDDADS